MPNGKIDITLTHAQSHHNYQRYKPDISNNVDVP